MRFSTGALATDGSMRTMTCQRRSIVLHLQEPTGHRRRYEVLADHVGYLLRCTAVIRSCEGWIGDRESRMDDRKLEAGI